MKYFSKSEKVIFVLVFAAIVALLVNTLQGHGTYLTNIALWIDAIVFGAMTGTHAARRDNAKKREEKP